MTGWNPEPRGTCRSSAGRRSAGSGSQDIYPFGSGRWSRAGDLPDLGVGSAPPAPPPLTDPRLTRSPASVESWGWGGEEETWILDVLLMRELQKEGQSRWF